MSAPEDIERELAALADGALPPERREQLLALLAADPQLEAELESQRQAVAIVRSLERVEAPSLLHRSIATQIAGEDQPAGTPAATTHPAGPRRGRRPARLRWQAAAAVALAAVAVLAVTITLTTGGSSPTAAPTVLQASSAAQGSSTQAAPAESPHNQRLLAASAAGISYPYWGGRLGWRTTGARTDTVGGRTVTTVFYADHAGRRIAYSIVSGKALAVSSESPAIEFRGVRFQVVKAAGPTVVTWREAGHTCILTAQGVDTRALVRLAAWERA
jgi:anti-sigma factor RsiW